MVLGKRYPFICSFMRRLELHTEHLSKIIIVESGYYEKTVARRSHCEKASYLINRSLCVLYYLQIGMLSALAKLSDSIKRVK